MMLSDPHVLPPRRGSSPSSIWPDLLLRRWLCSRSAIRSFWMWPSTSVAGTNPHPVADAAGNAAATAKIAMARTVWLFCEPHADRGKVFG
jgi:hypothetical protein